MQNVHQRLRTQIRNLGNRLVRQMGPRMVRGRARAAGRRAANGRRNGGRSQVANVLVVRRSGEVRDRSRTPAGASSPPDVVPRCDQA